MRLFWFPETSGVAFCTDVITLEITDEEFEEKTASHRGLKWEYIIGFRGGEDEKEDYKEQ